jgi:MYXO-CTERM domain-containing protein
MRCSTSSWVCQRSSYYDFTSARDLLITTIDYARSVNAELADDDLTADLQLMETLLVNIEANGYYDYCGNGECYYYGDDVVMSPLGCSTSGGAPGTAALWLLSALAGFLFIRRRR